MEDKIDTKEEAQSKAEKKAIELLNYGYEVRPFVIRDKTIVIHFVKHPEGDKIESLFFKFRPAFKAGYYELWNSEEKPAHPVMEWFESDGTTDKGNALEQWEHSELVPDYQGQLERAESWFKNNYGHKIDAKTFKDVIGGDDE